MIDRLIGLTVLVIVGAVAVSAAAPAIEAVALTGTACYAIVMVVLHYTRR